MSMLEMIAAAGLFAAAIVGAGSYLHSLEQQSIEGCKIVETVEDRTRFTEYLITYECPDGRIEKVRS